MPTKPNLDRRDFLKVSGIGAAALGAGVWSSRSAIASDSPNAKLCIACVGTANRAGADIAGVDDEQIVALCDVDDTYLDRAKKRFPDARTYVDYREMIDKEKLLAKAKKPGMDAMALHPFYRGKIEVVPKCIVRDFNDFAIWYTPGVAAPCRTIERNIDAVYQHTNKGNSVAVLSDGTRVLGLADIGPEAGLPVREGEALLYKYLGGVDAWPL